LVVIFFFSFGYGIVYSSLIYDFWLPLIYDFWLSLIYDFWLPLIYDFWLPLIYDFWLPLIYDFWLPLIYDFWLPFLGIIKLFMTSLLGLLSFYIYFPSTDLFTGCSCVSWPEAISSLQTYSVLFNIYVYNNECFSGLHIQALNVYLIYIWSIQISIVHFYVRIKVGPTLRQIICRHCEIFICSLAKYFRWDQVPPYLTYNNDETIY
jgi:hypothetical protein